MMMALGVMVFTMATIPYQQLQRTTSWRHASQSRIGQRAASQFLGEGDDSITLSGMLLPEVSGGRTSMFVLRLMADSGKAWPLIEGTGKIYGFWVVESIDETSSTFFRDGMEQQIDFTIKLKHVDSPITSQEFHDKLGSLTEYSDKLGLGDVTDFINNKKGGITSIAESMGMTS